MNVWTWLVAGVAVASPLVILKWLVWALPEKARPDHGEEAVWRAQIRAGAPGWLSQALGVVEAASQISPLRIPEARAAHVRGVLERAGYPGGCDADTFLHLSLSTAVASGVLGWLLLGLLGVSKGPGTLTVVLTLLGLVLPWVWLHERAHERRTTIEAAWPDALRLLGLFLLGGQDLGSALERWARSQTGPLGEEITLLLRKIQLGHSRHTALGQFGRRLHSPTIESTLAALVKAEQLGTPMASIAVELSTSLTRARVERLEAQIGEIPVRMLLPLALMTLSILLALGGALFLQFTQQGSP